MKLTDQQKIELYKQEKIVYWPDIVLYVLFLIGVIGWISFGICRFLGI